MNKINSRALLLLMSLSFVNVGYSQTLQNDKGNYTPPAPNAAGLLEYASVPVNLNTGTPQVAVPLYDLKGKNITVPISVSYHASGVKVQDMATSTGLGWVLNAGGVITRLVRGKPDESPQGYFNLNFDTSYGNVEGMVFNNIDTEPDLFFYNFVGRTGKMVLTPGRQPIQLPEQNLAIVAPDFSSADPKWEVTDLDGVKYIFGKTSNSREVSTITMHTQYAPNKISPNITNEFDDETYTTISSWYLTEIIYPVGREVVNFYYQSGSNVYFEEYSQSLQTPVEQNPSSCGAVSYEPNLLDHIVQVTIASPKYISSIDSYLPTFSERLGSVNFTYLNDRQDITNALRLTQVRITNKDYAEIKKYSFENNLYFVSDGCSTADCKRLKLDKIIETTNGVNLNTRVFQYNTTNLPSRKSVKYDHWGYYNNNTLDMAIPPSKPYPQFQAPPISFPGADKSPDLARTQANILTGFTNAAGGFQQLYYELNEYDDGGAIASSGGLRVSQIVENDGTDLNETITRNFKYRKTEVTSPSPPQSSGLRYRKNYYDYNFIVGVPCQDQWGDATYSLSIAYRYSSSCVDIFDVSGSHIGYSQVQIEYNNGSKEHLFFTNFLDHPDDPIEFTIPSGFHQSSAPDFTDPDGPPFIPKGDRSFERGLLTDHIFYNSNNKKIKTLNNHYDFFSAGSLEAPGCKAMILELWGPGVFGRRGKYKYLQRGVRVDATTENIYDQNDENKSVTKHTTLSYNSKFSMLVSNRLSHLNDGSVLNESYRYPFDYFSGTPVTSSDPNVDGLYLLCSKNMANVPIERTYMLKGPGETDGYYKATGSDLLTYKRNPLTNNPVPAASYRLSVTDPIWIYVGGFIYNGGFVFNLGFQKIQEYLTYDAYDNPLGEIAKTGENVAYEWDPETKYTSVKSITRETGDHQQRISYTYKPLVGLLTSTDPNGRITSYEYDLMNRLKLIRENGEVVKRFRYHYKNQEEGFTASLTFGSSKVQGSNLNISTNGDTDDGQMTYNWNFGDGSTATTSYYSTSHVFNNPGTYQVTVTKSHPEIGSSSASAAVIIQPPPAVSICADGPIDGDKCGINGMTYGGCTPNPSLFSPTIVTATVQSLGCGNLSYRWEHTSNGGGTFGNGQTSVYIPYTTGDYGIRCIISDGCGNEASSEWIYINLYRSGNCPE